MLCCAYIHVDDHPSIESILSMLRSALEQMLEAANWAPTHGRTEPWRFVVLSGEGLQEMISITDRVGSILCLAAVCKTT